MRTNMSGTRSYSRDHDFEKKIKRSEKGKRIVDKYRKAVYNKDSFDDEAFDEYLEHEVVQNKTKLR
jgi:hypothetical protein